MKKIIFFTACIFLSACGDNPYNDNQSIKDTDYAKIRLEMDRCAHVMEEGSVFATMRWSPKTDCLKHLSGRIIATEGNKNEIKRIVLDE